MVINMSDESHIEKDHATRLICAKLYEGGLWWANNILSSLEREPFVGKSPETGLDVGLISKHAEKAISYHLNYVLIAAGLAVLSIIVYFFNSMLSGIILAADVALMLFKSRYLDRKVAIDNFSKKAYNPNYNLERSQVTQGSNSDDAKQNVIIFGEYYPFTGAGYRVRNWNLVIDTTKPSKTITSNPVSPKEVSIKELYEAVFAEIQSKNIPNLSHEFLLFADGKELGSSFLMPHRISDEPTSFLDPTLIISEGHSSLYNEYRTYFSIKYFDKVRSTLLSTFVRFFIVGKELFIECSFYALPPIDENKFDIDRIPLYDDMFMIKAGAISAIFALITLVFAFNPFTAWIPLIIVSLASFIPLIKLYEYKYNKKGAKSKLKKNIEKGVQHNYGVKKTFRESISSANYKSYFSAQDIIMIQTSIDQAIVYSIAALLDSKDIDSSTLKENVLNFVNQGIISSVGTLNAEQMVIGNEAKLSKTISYASQKAQSLIKST
jgi:hypothetical protein